MPEPKPSVTIWRKLVAAVFDFFTAFVVLGFTIGALTGNLTETGFKLEEWPAWVFIGLMLAYPVVGRRTGGTLWERLLGVRSQR